MEKYIKHLEKNRYSVNTIQTYKNILKIYYTQIDSIDKVKKELYKHYNSPNTVWTHYNVICSYLKWVKSKNLNKLKELNLPKIPTKYLETFDKSFILRKTKINSWDSIETIKKKRLILFLFQTGIRVSEIKSIIDYDEIKITLLGKGNKLREVFHNITNTEKIRDINVSSKTIRLWVKEILGSNYTPHSIRRSFATHLLNKGANPKMVMLQMGHEKIETTFRYVNLSIDKNRKIYDKYF